LTYVNIHTTNNPAGEIRGQVLPWQFTATLTGAAEVPAISPAGSGSATFSLSGNVLTYSARKYSVNESARG